MPPSKNQIAATLTRDEAVRAGVVDVHGVQEHITGSFKRLFGFRDKILPKDLPKEPKLYIYSISEYGDIVNLGPGFQNFLVEPCPDGAAYGPPCIIEPLYFFKEAKVDEIEHTYTSGKEIADAILRIGAGMNTSWDRRKYGWMVSSTNPPSDEEVTKATNLYVAECKRLIQEASGYHARNLLNDITDTHRRAAKYLKEKVDWDTKQSHRMVECDMCREPIRFGTVVHAVPYCGAVQGVLRENGKITSPGRWADAIASGMKKLSDAPDEVQDLLE